MLITFSIAKKIFFNLCVCRTQMHLYIIKLLTKSSMNSEEYISLYEKYISGNCTEEEKERLFNYNDQFQLQDVNSQDTPEEQVQKSRVFNHIQAIIKPKRVVLFSRYWKWSVLPKRDRFFYPLRWSVGPEHSLI